ncbi:response regulator transcription factor [Paraburkholderia kururiensis]|uniref:Response regulator transcription factor n=1 Tax=Paraburkholderia kururiensis TaxID=984307 RepID=A0ABZ0WLC5_9BURK|nr:response regulator transcription factor [Paraburkholderia kururiensis]WQD78149.1 response regulator transcription factor [Paraburkholderia kururiensis]
MKVLAIEDDAAQADLIRTALAHTQHQVEIVESGSLAIRRLRQATPDLLILERNLPDISGDDMLTWIRMRLGADIPVLVLVGRSSEDDVPKILDAGADDYVVTPVRCAELAARVAVLLRRAYSRVRWEAHRIELGDYVIDIRDRTVVLRGKQQILSPREFDLASHLFRHPGRVFARGELYRAVWGKALEPDSRTLDTHIYRLRQKLELSARHGIQLRCVYQHGYCLERVPVPADAFRGSFHESSHRSTIGPF